MKIKKKIIKIILALIIALVVFIGIIFTLFYLADSYFDRYNAIFQYPIEIRSPIVIEEKRIIAPIIKEIEEGKLEVKNLEEYLAFVARENNIDEGLFLAIANCESRLDPKAKGITNDGGLFQFIPSTWIRVRKKMGEDPNPDLRFDFVENTLTAGFCMRTEGTGHWNSSKKCWGS